ncbi:MAG: mechanosensitive ion channel family protein [Chloroflexi bacterium]|nr:mechanosensitive ion channel family protein [Chloroflexota bacterium]
MTKVPSDRTSADAQKPRAWLTTALSVFVVLLGAIGVSLIGEIDEDTMAFLVPHKARLVTADVALTAVITIEVLVEYVLKQYEFQGARQAGVMMRAIIRTVSYSIVGVVAVTILASNPALAVSVGGMTGIIVGFSAQNLIGNILAGLLLALGRPFKLDDQITVMGQTGLVKEMGVMHTVLRSTESIVLIPNSALMTQVILRKPPAAGMEGE